MKSSRNPNYLERYEDVVFDLEQALDIDPANTAYQNRTITATDHNGIVNGSDSLIKRLSITANGREVYSCNYANHCVNIKNLLECNPSYAESIGTNEFYFLDTRYAEETKFTKRQVTHRRKAANNADDAGEMLNDVVANYHKGLAARKALLGTSSTVNCEIPLNRCSFFEALEDKLLPNRKIDLNIEIDKDQLQDLIWRQGGADGAGNNYRLIILRLQLFVPRLTFNSEGQKIYMENYLKPYKWVYSNENVERSNNSKQKTGRSRITNKYF